ncbi:MULTISPECIES: type IX secretion/gliding motility protein PorT/SprT [Hymenobacter]|uniref:PorT family protein n=1 Tax=Hymenobacter guriensis TaxID=2793065 RepID=A0ABS0L210_9BACT|nr:MULTISPECIES: porin family protein [Hymenobacter]MBG8553618.1 PorT family protein [Hymenobacter guriensis]MCR5886379.1 PorT family protein [Hymenobacter sp. J193]
MATPHVRYQLHLYRHQVAALLLALGLLAGHAAEAQSPTRARRGRNGNVKTLFVNNLPGYDDKWFHGGFQLNVSATRFRVEHSPRYTQSREVSANAIMSPSFGVNFVGDARLADFFTLRFTPGVEFSNRRIEYKPLSYSPADSIKTQEVGGTVLEFPLLLKFHSERRRNSRMYLIAGAKASVSVTNRRQDPETSVLRTAGTDYSLEYGVGMDLFYPFFKFAPELRFSHGLPNVLQNNSDVYSRNLQRLRTNAVTLYLNFE